MGSKGFAVIEIMLIVWFATLIGWGVHEVITNPAPSTPVIEWVK